MTSDATLPVHSDVVGLFAVLGLMLAIGSVVAASRLPQNLKLLVYAGLTLRVVGAVARYLVLFELYNGSGDAVSYYDFGLKYAAHFQALDFSPLWDRAHWKGSSWWGTQFMHFPSGLVLSLIGPTMLGEFLVFALFAFAGLIAFVVAYHRAYPDVSAARYARWLWLFPSLWFWPSSVGKEAITLCGFGFAVLGFIGKNGRMRLIPLMSGMFLVYAIRPQVAAVMVLSGILSYWLTSGTRWTLGRIVQGGVILVIGLGGIWYSLQSVGVGSFDVEGVQSYVTNDAARRVGGGSSVDAVPVSPLGMVLALVNVLLRPFPWEATNPMMLLSGLEIYGFWAIAWWRRRELLHGLRNWRRDRFVALALPLVAVYAVTLGLMLTNLGILARQRIFLFPFLFLIIEAAPRAVGYLASSRSESGRDDEAHGAGSEPALVTMRPT